MVKIVTVDRESAVPPYQQVAAILRDQITPGQIPPGRPLPSVTQLVQTYGIAKLTAQKALRVLRDEGLAVMVKGWGTYVSSHPPPPGEGGWLARSSAQAGLRFRPMTSS